MNRSFRLFFMAIALCIGIIDAKVIQVNDEDQYNQMVGNQQNTLVEFSADWCSVCNGIKKPFEEVANENEFQQIAFAQVDVDKLDSVSKQNGIVGVPTFVYLENGNKKVEEIGVQNMPAFKDHLRDNLRKTFALAQNQAADPELTPAAAMEELIVDIQSPAMPEKQEEHGFIMRLLISIKDFIIMILAKIQGFFVTIFDAIKGFFGG